MAESYGIRALRSCFVYGATALGIRAVNFLFFPFYIAHLSLQEFGLLDIYQVWIVMSTTFFYSIAAVPMFHFFGLASQDADREHAINQALSMLLAILLFIGMGISTFVYLSSASRSLVIILGCNLIVSICFSFLLAYFRMQEMHRQYAIVHSLQSGVQIIITAMGVYWGYGFYAFVYGATCSFALFLPLIFIFLSRHFSSWTFNWSYCWHGVSASLALLGLQLFFVTDRVMIGYADMTLLGVYAIVWRFGYMFQIGAQAVYDAWPTIFFNVYKNSRGFSSDFLFRYYALAITTGGLLICILSQLIVRCLVPVSLRHVEHVLPWFFFMLVIYEMARVSLSEMQISKKTKILPPLVLVASTIQILLFFFCNTYSLMHIVLINTISLLIYCALVGIYLKRILGRSLGFQAIAQCLTMYAGILCIISYATWLKIPMICVSVCSLFCWGYVVVRYMLTREEQLVLRSWLLVFLPRKIAQYRK